MFRIAIAVLPTLARLASVAKTKGDYDKSLQVLNDFYKPLPISFEKLEPVKEPIDLSFIVPVYNAERYLRKCIDSLVGQKTRYSYEVLLIDDGSTDTSPSIVDEYAKRFPMVRAVHQKNGGISVARNHGIECSQGKYLAFVDNDDFVTDDYVEKLLTCAYATDADMVKCGHHRWNVAEERIVSTIQYPDASYRGDIGATILKLKGFVWEGCSKRTLWTDFRFPEGYWFEDMITRMVLMVKAKRIETLGDVMYYYCLHQNNSSKSVWSHSNPKSLDAVWLLVYMLQSVNRGVRRLLTLCCTNSVPLGGDSHVDSPKRYARRCSA